MREITVPAVEENPVSQSPEMEESSAALRLYKRKHDNSTTGMMDDPMKKKAKVKVKVDQISKKLPTGVQLRRGRFRVRITHPETKNIVWLGTYDTVEEASLVYQNKKDEYRKQYGFTDQYRRPNLIKSDLPTGVYRINNGKFRARVLNPKLKVMVHIGTYETPEEASVAIRNKKEEFEKELGCCKEPLVRQPNVDEICCRRDDGKERDEFGEGEELHDGVRPRKMGGSGAWVEDPVLRIEDAVAVERERVIVEKTKVEINIDGRVVDSCRKPECGFDQIGSSTLLLEAENSRKDRVLNKTEKSECLFDQIGASTLLLEAENLRNGRVLNKTEKPECGFDQIGASTLLLEAENSRNGRVLNKTEKPECEFDHVGCQALVFEGENSRQKLVESSKRVNLGDNYRALGDYLGTPISAVKAEPFSDEPISTSTSFEECMRLGIIDQYGQLLGEYSKLDDTLWFDNHIKNEATTSIEGDEGDR